MDIALDRGNDDFPLGLDVCTGRFKQQFFGFNIRQQMRHCLLHHACAFHNLRQKHFALTKQVANHIHAVHQRAFNHMQRTATFSLNRFPNLLRIRHDVFIHAVNQRMRQTLAHRQCTPFVLFAVIFGTAFGGFGHFNQAFTRCEFGFARFVDRLAVQHDIFNAFAQQRLEVVIHAHHAGIDDAHVHTGLNGVVQKYGVDGFAHRVVAAKTERHV